MELPNTGLKLKPDMFVNARIRIPLGESLVVPAAAVMDTGKRQVVWVEMKPGIFTPRDVKVGTRVGDNIQIISGLLRGDKVAASGGYLIDSEAQLKGGGGHAGHEGMKVDDMKMDGPKAPASGAAPPPKKGGMSMDDMKM